MTNIIINETNINGGQYWKANENDWWQADIDCVWDQWDIIYYYCENDPMTLLFSIIIEARLLLLLLLIYCEPEETLRHYSIHWTIGYDWFVVMCVCVCIIIVNIINYCEDY